MQNIALVVLAVACGQGPADVDDNMPADSAEEEAAPFDPAAAALTVELANTVFSVPLPVTLTREERIVAQGMTGESFTVGVGDVNVIIGPHIIPSASGINYYPGEDGFTEDGWPMIISSDRRYVELPFVATIDRLEQTVGATLVGVVGEGTYGCSWEMYEIDESKASKKGERIHTSGEITGQVGLAAVPQNELPEDSLPRFRLTPQLPLEDFNDLVHADQGEYLYIAPTPDGPYSSTVVLHSPIGNTIIRPTVKGIGLNDFAGIFVDNNNHVVREFICKYDWRAKPMSY